MHSPSSVHPIPHKQVPAKVTVYVDERIKDLVELINTFDGIYTYESCQGFDDYAQIWIDGDILEFAEKISSILANDIEIKRLGIASAEYDVDISIHWEADKKRPYLLLQFPNKDIGSVVNILSHVRTRLIDDNQCKQLQRHHV